MNGWEKAKELERFKKISRERGHIQEKAVIELHYEVIQERDIYCCSEGKGINILDVSLYPIESAAHGTSSIITLSPEICVLTSGFETKKRPEIPFIFYWLFFKYSQNLGHSAPLRTITVKDSIGDLPGNCGGPQMKYKNCRISPFQKQMRDNSKILHDHETKSLSRLCQERIKNIPKKSGADWRDLPNIEIKNRDGLVIKKLYLTSPKLTSRQEARVGEHAHDFTYTSSHHGVVQGNTYTWIRLQYKYGKDQNGIMRGVCSCADGKVNESCNINDRQFNTLIPWWLPHTAERNNNFAGVYGRLDWEDHFSTTLTKPNPQGKQGRVLHPQEDRIISIRECARSQGFFDTFHFYGSIAERYRQVLLEKALLSLVVWSASVNMVGVVLRNRDYLRESNYYIKALMEVDDEDEVFLGFDNTVEAHAPSPDGSGEDGYISSTPDDTAPSIDVGNAVAPPLAAAIGYEIRKCLVQNK
uniref:DNA (cytosine-5-)-methyltransferase n=1 Tax=Timema tahoe TaxID=61484 RepID=A0A7R9ILQ3_9NEOP|nr:unnamed protein product [Timema tahoe]